MGGQAETLHGSARITFDVDLCYGRTGENLTRLVQALAALHPTLGGAPSDLPFRIDARSLVLRSNFTFITNLGPLGLLGYLEPIGGYEEAAANSLDFELGPHRVKVLSLDDLIQIKEHIQRPKDRDSLMHMNAIQRLRDEDSEEDR